MNHAHHNHRPGSGNGLENGLENDPVWTLLGQASTPQAGPRFVDDVVRLAKLDGGPVAPWWKRWFASPGPAAAFAGAAAAVLFGLFLLKPSADAPHDSPAPAISSHEVEAERLEHIQEVLETELLLVAVEHLNEFTDDELVALIGF